MIKKGEAHKEERERERERERRRRGDPERTRERAAPFLSGESTTAAKGNILYMPTTFPKCSAQFFAATSAATRATADERVTQRPRREADARAKRCGARAPSREGRGRGVERFIRPKFGDAAALGILRITPRRNEPQVIFLIEDRIAWRRRGARSPSHRDSRAVIGQPPNCALLAKRCHERDRSFIDLDSSVPRGQYRPGLSRVVDPEAGSRRHSINLFDKRAGTRISMIYRFAVDSRIGARSSTLLFLVPRGAERGRGGGGGIARVGPRETCVP